MKQEKSDKRIFTLREEKPAKAVLRMGLPLVAGMFIMVLYNLVDTYFIGLTGDAYQLAAVNLAYPVMMIAIAISNMVSSGAASLIARSLGAGDEELAERTLAVAFFLTVCNGVIIAVLGLLFLPQLVTLLGAKSNTFDFTAQYVTVLLWGNVFTMGNYTMGQLLRSEGSVRLSVVGMVVGTVANILLDPLFIFGFGMQIRGAAIATVLGNALGMLVSLWFYLRRKALLRLSIRKCLPKRKILKEIFWVGVPASLETLLTTAAYVINNNLAVSYGELAVAAMGVAQKIMTVGSYIYQGMAAGIQPIMGYNYGAKNYWRMLEILRAGVLITSAIECSVMAVYGIFAPWLIGIFSDAPEVITTGSRVLRTIMLILPFVGAVSMCRMSFQAMGKAVYAFMITLVRQIFLYIPLLLILNQIFGFDGMLFAQPITEAVMMVASVTLLVRFLRKGVVGQES